MNPKACTKNILLTLGVLSLTALLPACSGGGGGGSDGDSRQSPDPVVVDLPIAYVKRDISGVVLDDDLLVPDGMTPGAALFIRDRASSGAGETNISDRAFGGATNYDVKDVQVSYDGNRLLFSMRAPQDPGLDEDDPNQPRWNIWEYDLDTDTLRRVIQSNIIAQAGHDISPHYLPNNRIVFASTRQQRARAILVDEGKPQYSALEEDRQEVAFVLHTMRSDGTDIKQITFNQSHDLNPAVLPDGRLVFTRWDNAGGSNALSLYSVRPDGRQLEFLYGYHSQLIGTSGTQAAFVKPTPMPDGSLLALLRANQTSNRGHDIVRVSTNGYTEIYQPTWGNAGAPGPGHNSLSFREVTTDGTPSPHGFFSSAFPMYDGTDRLLVGWTQCRLQDPGSMSIIPCTDDNLAIPGVLNAPPLFSLWIYDLADGTQRVVASPQEGLMYTEVAVMAPRPEPTLMLDGEAGVDLDVDLVNEAVGVLHVRSVYDFDGANIAGSTPVLADPLQTNAALRPARFVRIEKAVPMPDDETLDFDNSAFGRSAAQLMREILGYAVIEPDGSFKVKVPANVPFAISVLNADGQRIFGRHQNWLQLLPGEERECNGCHADDSLVPHGRPGAEPPTVNLGAPTTGVPFANTNIGMIAAMGETMAETRARINGIPSLSVDIVFRDIWTNPGLRALDADIDYLYADLDPTLTAPATDACQTSWTSLCRTIINYPTHIAPLWDLDRGANTCTNCHSERDAMNNLRVPLAQLDLSNTPSPANSDHLVSYRELLFPDAQQTLNLMTNMLENVQVQDTDEFGNLLFLTNAQGDLILDPLGNPIPIMVDVPANQVMFTAGARASSDFFAPFAPGQSHDGYLSPAELKLIAEWVDIGAQYYNNPFDAPLN